MGILARLNPMTWLYLFYAVGLFLVAFWPNKWRAAQRCTADISPPYEITRNAFETLPDSSITSKTARPPVVFAELEATWLAECKRWLAHAVDRIRKK
jgi:hypothetical protein